MYKKPANTSHPIHELIQHRWSPRAFSGASVDKVTLTKLFEAARWASSRFNSQPWRFIVATQDDSAEFNKLFNCLMGGNQPWAKDAGALVVVVASLKGKPESAPNPAFMYDVGLAVGQMVIEAMANGLYVHQMAGVHRDQIKAAYDVPKAHAIVCCLAIGEMGDKDALPEPYDKREVAPRSRRPLSEFVFSGTWGNSAEL